MTRQVETYQASHYTFEHKKLVSLIKDDIMEALVENRAIIAGGAITSLFTNNEIHDFDLYFRTRNEMEKFTAAMFGVAVEFDSDNEFESISRGGVESNTHCIGYTDKSVMFTSFEGRIFQVIAFDTFEEPKDIFDKYDFSVNMGAYDCAEEKWVFDKNFLKDNSQRSLSFNPKTAFPLISLLRVGKYQARGYRISKKDMMKIGIAVSNLSLRSWSDAKKHLSGMYGTNVDSLFADAGEFTEEGLYDILDNAEHEYINRLSIDDSHPAEKRDDVNWVNCLQSLRIKTGADNILNKGYAIIGESIFGVMDNSKEFTLGTHVKGNSSTAWQVDVYLTKESLKNRLDFLQRNRWTAEQGYISVIVDFDKDTLSNICADEEGQIAVAADISFTLSDVIYEEQK